jgi:hypothetical protein
MSATAFVEVEVGTAPQEIEEVFAKGLVRIRSHRGVLGSVLQFSFASD